MTRFKELAMLNPWLVAGVTLVMGLAAAFAYAQAADRVTLKVGDPAPAFSLPGSDGQTHALADRRGHVVVLAWFPKAFTGG